MAGQITSPGSDWFGATTNGNGGVGMSPSPSNWFGQTFFDVGALTGPGEQILGEGGEQILGEGGEQILG